jgi:vanillate O-demethylase ferredoxin subunit
LAAATLVMRVASVEPLAEGIAAFELRAAGGGVLPPFTAGAHVDLHLPNRMIRSYSLVNPQEERDRYVIAVKREDAGRGGSRLVHEALRPGVAIEIAGPRNNFPLAEDAPHSLFIAGGIGITPILCMVRRLRALGRSWALIYCARTRRQAAFADSLERFGPQVRFNFDQAPGGRMLDIAATVASAGPDTHLYCCGPLGMLAAFERATAERAPSQVHVEYFSPKAPPAAEGGFEVVLARAGASFRVPRGKTILDTLIEHGVDAPYSCLEGVCGTCETRVLEGVPDHRDLVLSKEERAAGRTMMICCSGSRTGRLVLDL